MTYRLENYWIWPTLNMKYARLYPWPVDIIYFSLSKFFHYALHFADLIYISLHFFLCYPSYAVILIFKFSFWIPRSTQVCCTLAYSLQYCYLHLLVLRVCFADTLAFSRYTIMSYVRQFLYFLLQSVCFYFSCLDRLSSKIWAWHPFLFPISG